MARVVRDSLSDGCPAVLLIGGDVPLLPVDFIQTSAHLLAAGGADLALTPAHDGGYAMIGLSRPCDPLFDSMEWSTPQVLPETLRRAARMRLRVRLTDPVADCDTPDDLFDLLERYRADPEAFRTALPRTTAFLDQFELVLNRGDTEARRTPTPEDRK